LVKEQLLNSVLLLYAYSALPWPAELLVKEHLRNVALLLMLSIATAPPAYLAVLPEKEQLLNVITLLLVMRSAPPRPPPFPIPAVLLTKEQLLNMNVELAASCIHNAPPESSAWLLMKEQLLNVEHDFV
jgi:hypothetical protein